MDVMSCPTEPVMMVIGMIEIITKITIDKESAMIAAEIVAAGIASGMRDHRRHPILSRANADR